MVTSGGGYMICPLREQVFKMLGHINRGFGFFANPFFLIRYDEKEKER